MFPRSAARLGVRLDQIRYLLVTHDHYDHASGATLLTRRWAGVAPLTVVGPPSALAALSPWLPPADPEVDFRPVTAGDVLTLGSYTVRALAADHDSDGAVIYDVASSTRRILYATDTGPGFSTPANARYDLLLLENSWGDRPVAGATGHHGLASFATTLARLRREKAIDDHSRVVAIHLGHGNPAPSILRARLAAMGSELLPDGAVIRLDDAFGSCNKDVAPPNPGARWCTFRKVARRRTAVGGGAGGHLRRHVDCGLSRDGYRVARADRGAPSTTTCALDDGRDDRSHQTASSGERRRSAAAHRLPDCLAGRNHGKTPAYGQTAEKPRLANADAGVAEAVDGLVLAWRTTAARVVAVSNEVGSGVVPPYPSGRRFRDELGALNARLAAESDEVLVVEAGISRSLLHPPAVQYPPAVQSTNQEQA